MILLWLLGGLVLVTVAFFLPGASLELWPSLNAAGLAAAIYLLALVAYVVRNPFPMKTRIITWTVVILVGASTASGWIGMDYTSHWQKETLLKIRGTIGRGILQATLPDTLLNVLKTYHTQGPKNQKTLGQIFKERYPALSEGQHFPPVDANSQQMIFAATVSESLITLVGQEQYAKGRDLNFKNYDGQTGRIQSRAMLTVKGLVYESEN